MATLKPFAALRPKPELAAQICELPYDVMSSEEARQMAAGNPLNFLHVSKPEIDLAPGVDLYSDAVYAKGKENFTKLISQGALKQDAQPCFYLYRQIMGGHTQIGLVAAASCEEYLKNIIKKHEFTRPDKEDDRVRHIETLNSQTGPVFLTYRAVTALDEFIAKKITENPDVDFTGKDGVRHTSWTVGDAEGIQFIAEQFAKIPFLYIADGHHRSAAAGRVYLKRKETPLPASGHPLPVGREEGRGEGTPHLIVCPTSLVFNWVAEAKKFTPKLKVLALSGTDRHALFEQIATSDIVVTSYALIRRDAEKYREIEFDTVVLDEAQHIKNRQTQNAQAVKAVRAQHRLVLTGTPLENSVLDLWSIFDFLMPGYLGTAQDFRERYELPIAKEKNVEAQARLARRLRPFLLRRLKKDVAADLPAKLEQVSFCELTPDQRSVYQQVIEASRKEVLEAVGAQGIAKSRMVVLTALLRLRQICCDLRLLKLEPRVANAEADDGPAERRAPPRPVSEQPSQRAEAAPGAPATVSSGKLELFGELLEEVIDGGHRVLVFSQFVGMLTLLKEQLAAEGIEYCYLDGSTTDRAKVVEKFQTNAAIPVFLISLKAGGVGLNLTGADTVVHFDPWWNPAVEDQATDRAHRIGQTKVVTSYKLITRDTVEEKILTLQNRKREIIQATIGGEEEFAASLNWEEIQELLA